jgi:hypothetical protein
MLLQLKPEMVSDPPSYETKSETKKRSKYLFSKWKDRIFQSKQLIYLKGLNNLEILGSHISLQTKRINAEDPNSYEAQGTFHTSIQTGRKISQVRQ